MENYKDSKERDLIICRCEEITKAEIMNSIREGYLTTNDIRKRTRAGMGFCQGKTCGKQVQQIIAQYTGQDAKDIPPARTRPPTRPIPAVAFANGCDEIE